MAMTDYTRGLMLKVHGDYVGNEVYLYHIDCFVGKDEILKWLIRHGYTGKKFMELVRDKFSGSSFLAGKYVLSQLKRANGLAPVYSKKDFN